MPERVLNLGLVQHACGPGKEANVETAARMIREAAGRGAELVVTQELFASRYFPQEEDERCFALAEPIPGPTSERLCGLAKELRVAICGSLFEKRAPGLFHNTTVMIESDGRIIDRYRKMHIPHDPRFYEKFYFTPGDLGFRAPRVSGGRCAAGMLVCWDQWFPEAARITALRGAQVLLYPTAIGSEHGGDQTARGGTGGQAASGAQWEDEREAWMTVQRGHAITNGVFVAAVNRTGVEKVSGTFSEEGEGRLNFWGSSFVADPMGRILAQAPRDEPAVVVAECDLNQVDQHRRDWPFLRDRRIDAYASLARRYLE